MNFKDIKPFIEGHYRVDIPLRFLESTIERYKEEYNLEVDPDFQRAHVWNQEQQIAFVEHVLKGGQNTIMRFNCPGWMGNREQDIMQLVDGKQRLTAVLAFLNNKILVFNCYYQDFEGFLPLSASMQFIVNKLTTRKEVLQWYLEINKGTVAHTSDEISFVEDLLEKEEGK